MATFEYETRLNCSPEALFDFLTRVSNIAKISPPDLGLTFKSAPETVQLDSELSFEIVTFGQVVKSTHRIVEFDRSRLVVEEQLVGPMKSWLHRHEYEATPEGVLKRDVVTYERPGGIIGMLLSDAKIQDQLEDGFFHREQQLQKLIESGELA